jgi:hypothetical protein
MSEIADQFPPPCGVCGAKWTADHACFRNATIPRVAESLDDLRVGQAVAFDTETNGWVAVVLRNDEFIKPSEWEGQRWDGGVVILSDPPAEPLEIRRSLIDELVRAYPPRPGDDLTPIDQFLRAVVGDR